MLVVTQNGNVGGYDNFLKSQAQRTKQKKYVESNSLPKKLVVAGEWWERRRAE